MTMPTTHDSAVSHFGLTNAPMRFLSLVKMTSGITANDSCRLSTTWLNTSRLPVLLSPNYTIVMSAGTSASRRVTSRRSHAGRRM